MTARVKEILISVKFDVGGTFEHESDLTKAVADLTGQDEQLNPGYAIDMVDARTYNISYLATHLPIQTVARPDRELRLGATAWRLGESLVIYPWLGVFSVDLRFRDPDPEPTSTGELLSFYDAFIAVNNVDYLEYLQGHGLLTRRLEEYQRRQPSTAIDIGVGKRADDVRRSCAEHVTSRAPLYPFQNVRVLYVVEAREDAESDRGVIAALVNLSSSLEPSASSDDTREVRELSIQGLTLVSSGWSTVVIEHGDADDVHSEGSDRRRTDQGAASWSLAEDMFGLVHAQWFLCQVWSGIGRKLADESAQETLEQIAEAQLRLGRDLVEVANVDVMFRDPERIALTQFFVEALRVDGHKELAKENLQALASRYRRLSDQRTARFSDVLQVLFALAAAAGVAALVPQLTPFKGWGLRVATALVAVPLFLVAVALARLYSSRR